MSGTADVSPGGAGAVIAPEMQMLQLASGHIAAQAIHVFATLGIADLLREGAKDVQALAGLTGSRDYSAFRFDGGHIGIYVSRHAQQLLPRTIAQWLAER